MASPVLSPVYSDDSCVPGCAVESPEKRIARREHQLAWEWPRRPRESVNFRAIIDAGGRIEAERWKAGLESGVVTEQGLEASFKGRAFYIPSTAGCDRYFLSDPSHARYVEKARGYLDGTCEMLPLMACPELWVYPFPFVRPELRAKFVHTRQASREFKVFLSPHDWDMFGSNPAAPGRYNQDARLGVGRSLFPSIPEDLLSLWPSDGLYFSLPPIAVYWGMAREKMTGEQANRYDHVLRAELALFAAVALHVEAVTSRRLWYLTEGVRTFIKHQLEEDVPPLERDRSIGALPMSALLEKVNCQGTIPQSWLQPRRVGVFSAMSVTWDEDTGRPVESTNRGGRSQRRGYNTTRGRQHHSQERTQVIDTVHAGSRRPDPYATDRASTGAGASSTTVWNQRLRSDGWLAHAGAQRLLRDACLTDYDSWSVSELLGRLEKTYVNEYDYAEYYKNQADEASGKVQSLETELAALKKQVPMPGNDVGQMQFDLQRLRRERNGLREEVEWYRSQSQRYKRQRDELAAAPAPMPVYSASQVTPQASSAKRPRSVERYRSSPPRRDSRPHRGIRSPPPKVRKRDDASPQGSDSASPEI